MNKWYEKAGEHSDVAISTRIRLARNISKYPFPCKLTSSMKMAVIGDLKEALSAADFEGYNFSCISTSELSVPQHCYIRFSKHWDTKQDCCQRW